MYKQYRIQNIFIKPFTGKEVMIHMYYRGTEFIYENADGGNVLNKGSVYDFFTYFNSLSLEKWVKYTYAKCFYIVIDGKGKYEFSIFGHFYNGKNIEKEYLRHYIFDIKERQKNVIPIPYSEKSQVIGFEMKMQEETIVYDSYYAADVEETKISAPYIALTTTTFKKEDYIQRNIELLNKGIFGDEEYAGHFCWNIIDNGRTLPEQTDMSQKIRMFHNKNVGGAGGFARGMIEGLTQPDKPTHILLMDDDVNFSTESFKRLYKLLSILRPEYKEYFVSGAMLKMNMPNIQHEDIGKLNKAGYHEAVKPNLDLNLWDSVLINEKIDETDEHRYGAWWFCCIPVGIARLDNLPLPVFVRGDDVEYSLRNKARFITMNGICIWHDGFEGKFSAALEYYQVTRNELILTAMHQELSDVNVMSHVEEIFWQELYKFNYKGASLLLDAVEDFLRGPDFFLSINLFEKLQEKRKEDNQLFPITEDIRKLIDNEDLFVYEKLSGSSKFIYDYTYNGQARIPEFILSNRAGVIPYGWGYFPKKQCLTRVNYAIDTVRDKYAVYTKDRREFERLKKRFVNLKNDYVARRGRVEAEYQNILSRVTQIQFWNDYFKKE